MSLFFLVDLQLIAEIWFSKGKAHLKLKQHDEALNSFEEALKLDPENQDVLNAKKELLELMNYVF